MMGEFHQVAQGGFATLCAGAQDAPLARPGHLSLAQRIYELSPQFTARTAASKASSGLVVVIRPIVKQVVSRMRPRKRVRCMQLDQQMLPGVQYQHSCKVSAWCEVGGEALRTRENTAQIDPKLFPIRK
jgi:hypothetical protein